MRRYVDRPAVADSFRSSRPVAVPVPEHLSCEHDRTQVTLNSRSRALESNSSKRRLITMQLAGGAHEAETRADECSLRSYIVERRVGNDFRHPDAGGNTDGRLCGVPVAAGRRSKAVADLNAPAARLALKAGPSDGAPIGKTGDTVVAEGRCSPYSTVERRKPRTAPTSPSNGKSSAQASAGPAVPATMRSASSTSIACSNKRCVSMSGTTTVNHDASASTTEFQRRKTGAH